LRQWQQYRKHQWKLLRKSLEQPLKQLIYQSHFNQFCFSSSPFSTSSQLPPSSSGKASVPPPPPSTVNLQSPPSPPGNPSPPSGSYSGGNGGLASLQNALTGGGSLYPSPNALGTIPGSSTLTSNTPPSNTPTSNTPSTSSGVGSDNAPEGQ